MRQSPYWELYGDVGSTASAGGNGSMSAVLAVKLYRGWPFRKLDEMAGSLDLLRTLQSFF
jgi:hypothetical protein